MSLLFSFISSMYMVEALIMQIPTVEVSPNPVAQVIWLNKLNAAFSVLTWTTLLAVKFSFLVFFKRLIKGLHEMTIYWRTITSITTFVWAFGVVAVFLPCPYFSLKSRKLYLNSNTSSKILTSDTVQCAQTSELTRAIAFSTIVTVFDILTDILSSSTQLPLRYFS